MSEELWRIFVGCAGPSWPLCRIREQPSTSAASPSKRRSILAGWYDALCSAKADRFMDNTRRQDVSAQNVGRRATRQTHRRIEKRSPAVRPEHKGGQGIPTNRHHQVSHLKYPRLTSLDGNQILFRRSNKSNTKRLRTVFPQIATINVDIRPTG